MTDIVEDQAPEQSELDVLKARATHLGISFAKNVTVETLKKKITQELSDEQTANSEEEETEEVTEAPKTNKPKTRVELKAEALKLVRIRLTCMNPNKRELEGEIYAAGNSVIGMVKKYVPYHAEDGWHVPQIILNVLKEKQFLQILTDKKNRPTTKLIKEFAIEILPPLTKAELEELARKQAMAKGQTV